MLGINWVDCIILGLLIGSVITGLKLGLFIQLCTLAGLLVGLFGGGWLIPHVLPIHDKTLQTIVNVNLVLMLAGYTALRGFDLGHRLHWSVVSQKLRRLESGAGVLLSTTAGLLLVWLIAAMLGRLPFEGLSNSVNDALIVQKLYGHLPPVPAAITNFNRLVDPNSSPRLFVKASPLPTADYRLTDFQAAAVKGGQATVRITSFGCGNLVAGSGFVVGKDLVLTNAHVVAGVERPIVKYQGRSYEALPVVFDKGLDLAALRVKQLNAQPLALAGEQSTAGTTVAVIGYPKGEYAAVPGIIRNTLNVSGTNIYGIGVISRNVYEVQVNVDDGNSGGPMVLADGRVAGMIFAKSAGFGNYGYALTSTRLKQELAQAKESFRRVSTGACLTS
jgi:S1-C subfamily serine protease